MLITMSHPRLLVVYVQFTCSWLVRSKGDLGLHPDRYNQNRLVLLLLPAVRLAGYSGFKPFALSLVMRRRQKKKGVNFLGVCFRWTETHKR